MSDPSAQSQKPSYLWAVLTLVLPIAIFMYGFLFLNLRPPLVPLILALTLAGLMCLRTGCTWDDLQQGMFNGIARIHIALAILALTGGIIGTWIACGTIPAIIYWGIKLIEPEIFLMSAMLLCLVTSMSTGTSLGTTGTMGVAIMAIGQVFGFPPHMTAGAIISGAWFGDKMSPLSDASNVSAAVCEVSVFQLISAMLWSTIPALLFSTLAFYFIGLPHASSGITDQEINTLLATLSGNFNVGLVSFLPPAILIFLAYRKCPVLPCLIASIIGAILVGLYNGVAFPDILRFMSSGFVAKTGIGTLDSILSRGGVVGMSSTIILIMLCMCFGGMLERARVFEVLLEPLVQSSKSVFKMVVGTVVSSYLLLLGTGSASLAEVVVGRAFIKPFRDADIHPVILSRSIEDSATVSTIFVPWSAHSLFIGAVLGVSTFDYAPYAIFNWSATVGTLLCALTGFGVWKVNGTPMLKGFLGGKGIAPFKPLKEMD